MAATRARWLAGTGAALLVAALWWNHARLDRAASRAVARAESLEAQLAEAEAAAARRPELEREAVDLQREIDLLAGRLPAPDRVQGLLLERLIALARESGLALVRFSATPVQGSGKGDHLEVAAAVRGDLGRALLWVRSVAELPYVIRFQSALLRQMAAPREATAYPVEVSLSFRLYLAASGNF